MKSKQKINSKNSLSMLGGIIPPIVLSMIVGLTAVNPVWGVLFASAMGIIHAWGSFGQSRINELVTFLDKHKDEFSKKFLESDKFKSVFINVLERHMKEVVEEKRQLLRKYLLNVGKSVRADFDDHSKILFVLDQISLHEVSLLKWLNDQNLENMGPQQIHEGFVWNNNPPVNAVGSEGTEFSLQMLGNYGLVFVGTGGYGGTRYAISNFGRLFLDFISS